MLRDGEAAAEHAGAAVVRNLGRVRLKIETAVLASAAAANGGTIDVPRVVWMNVVNKARRGGVTPAAGDLFWVQEPCVLYKHTKFETNQIVFGDVLSARAPEGWRLDKVRKYVDDGHSLSMQDTRHTLEVKSQLPDGALRCAVHAENVSLFMRRTAA